MKGLHWLDGGVSGHRGVARGGVMTKADHGEVERLREVCGDFVQRCGGSLGSGYGPEKAALKRLCGEGMGYGGAARGDVVPLVMENLSLPSSDRAFEVGEAFPEMGEWEKWMLKSHDEMPSMGEIMACGSHCDASLRGGSGRLTELAVALWTRGLVKPVRRKGRVGVTAFAVAKDEVRQRLVFDMRRCNEQFKKPPQMAMGSPRALSYLDLSVDALGEDEVGASFGDVECFFYCLRGGNGLSEWLWLEGFGRPCCVRAARRRSWTVATAWASRACPWGGAGLRRWLKAASSTC